MLDAFQLLLFVSPLFHSVKIILSCRHASIQVRGIFLLQEKKPNKKEKDVTPSGIFVCGTHVLGIKRMWLALVNEHDSVSTTMSYSYARRIVEDYKIMLFS